MTTYLDDPDYRMLLAVVCSKPDDLNARRILADWLAEHGQQARADFINDQLDGKPGRRRPEFLDGLARIFDLSTHDAAYDGDIPGRQAYGTDAMGWDSPQHTSRYLQYSFANGFLGKLECRMDTWIRFGQAIVRCEPLAEVSISNREPWDSGTTVYGHQFYKASVGYAPGSHDYSDIPDLIWDLLNLPVKSDEDDQDYGGPFTKYARTAGEANIELSAACLKWARLPF